MKTRFTEDSTHSRAVPVRRINIVPLLAIIVIGAIGATLVWLFPMDWARAPNVTVNTEHRVISPNADGNLDTAPLIYSISEDAVVKVEVLDESHSLVRALIDGEMQAAGQHTLVWDGLDRLGQTLPDGKYFVRVSAQAAVKSASSTAEITLDTDPPIIRLANLPEDTQVGADVTRITIEGVTDPEATLWLNNGVQPLEVTSSGSFKVDYVLQEGVNRIELVAVDKAGNQTSVVRQITLLTQPPNVVVRNPPDNLWINQRMLSVQGAVQPGIRVRVNGNEATVDAQGNFNVDIVLEEGENIVRVEAMDAVNNTTVEERRVFLRTRPPALALTSVRDGMTVREPSLLVIGQSEPQAAVTINGRAVAVDNQGGFQGLVELIEGQNVIRVEAVDRAGNTSRVVREVTYAAATATNPALPPVVRNILAVAGLGVAGVTLLWLVSGLWQRPLTLALRVTRDTLTPGVGGRLEPAVVVFELSRPATVTAEVRDLSNRRVAVVFHNQRRTQGEHLLVWDGRGADGQIAPPGAYEVEVRASTLFTTVSSGTRLTVEQPVQPVWEQIGRRGDEQARYERSVG